MSLKLGERERGRERERETGGWMKREREEEQKRESERDDGKMYHNVHCSSIYNSQDMEAT